MRESDVMEGGEACEGAMEACVCVVVVAMKTKSAAASARRRFVVTIFARAGGAGGMLYVSVSL